MIATLYDELDAIIDKVQSESAYHSSSILLAVAQDLRGIRDRLPEEIEEITVVTTNHVLTDVLVNGKPVKCYCIVPKDQLHKYLKGRNFD